MLGIVLINYKNEEEVIHFVQKELIKISEPHVTVIVDNSCNEENITTLKTRLGIKDIDNGINKKSSLFLINAKANLGYARGNNLGAKFLKDNFDCKYILFSNSDIKIEGPKVIEYLLDKLETQPEIGAINPKIVGKNGENQNPMKHVSLLRLHVLRYLFYPLCRRISTLVYNAKEGVYHRLMGCFLLVRSDAFFRAEMFDPHTFLFGEELILAERMRKINYQSYFVPAVKITHLQSQTIGSFHSFTRQLGMMLESELYYYKVYRNASVHIILLAKFSFRFFVLLYIPFIKLFKSKKIS